MKLLFSLSLAGLLLAAGAASAGAAPRELTETELDAVAAGGLSTNLLDGLLAFEFGGSAGGVSIDGTGTISLSGSSMPGNLGMIYIGQQKDVSTIVNLAAVHSQVAVGVNININVNSANISVVQNNLGVQSWFVPLVGSGF